MKRVFTILISGLTTFSYAQQLPQYSQWMFNQYQFNPAYAGTTPTWEAVSLYRYQWLGITDGPRTFTASVQGPLSKENMAVGGHVYTDITGPTRRVGFLASYAYHARLSENIKLSFGVAFGFNQWILDADKVTTYHPGDFYFSNGLLRSYDPDAQFGLYLYHPDWFFGVSLGQLLHNNLTFTTGLNTPQTWSGSYMEDHFYFTGGYTFRIGESWQIQPSALLKTGWPAPVKLDINLKTMYKETIWVGAGFRSQDAWSVMAGFKYKNMLSIGYSYDITHTDLRNYSTGSHEIMMGFTFGYGKPTDESTPSLE